MPTSNASSGLGNPDLTILYTDEERASRDLLISWMELSDGETESQQPLAQFLSPAALNRVEEAGGEAAIDTIWALGDDSEVAGIPGLTAVDVYDARLSRNALEGLLENIADRVADAFDENGASEALLEIYPYGATAIDPGELAMKTRAAALHLKDRLNEGHEYPANSTAEEMILVYAVHIHHGLVFEAGIDDPACDLGDVLFEDHDFLMLYDPAMDGIENSDVAETMGMTITGPAGWFEPFRVDAAV